MIDENLPLELFVERILFVVFQAEIRKPKKIGRSGQWHRNRQSPLLKSYWSSENRRFPISKSPILDISFSSKPFQSPKMFIFCLTCSIQSDFGIGMQPSWYCNRKQLFNANSPDWSRLSGHSRAVSYQPSNNNLTGCFIVFPSDRRDRR